MAGQLASAIGASLSVRTAPRVLRVNGKGHGTRHLGRTRASARVRPGTLTVFSGLASRNDFLP